MHSLVCVHDDCAPRQAPQNNLARRCTFPNVQCTTSQISTKTLCNGCGSGTGNNGIVTDPSDYIQTDNDLNPWWYVDLGQTFDIGYVKVFNRADDWSRLQGFRIYIGNNAVYTQNVACASNQNAPQYEAIIPCSGRGRYVHIMIPRIEVLTFREIEVYPPEVSCATSVQGRQNDAMFDRCYCCWLTCVQYQ